MLMPHGVSEPIITAAKFPPLFGQMSAKVHEALHKGAITILHAISDGCVVGPHKPNLARCSRGQC